jgi:uncharacterized protein (TIGR02996 family)
LLLAIESNPTDDLVWLVFADLLEEWGEPLSRVLRETLEDQTWSLCRCHLFLQLDGRQRRLLACDCVERVLPLFEISYPADARPRQLVEALRQAESGPRVEEASAAVSEAIRVAERDARRNPARFLAARKAVQSSGLIDEKPNLACLAAAETQVVHRFGPEVLAAPLGKFRPEWREACHAEFRWQVARLLRYRFGLL